MSRDDFASVFDYGPDRAVYRRVSAAGVGRVRCGGRTCLRVSPGALARLAAEAFADLAFYLRPSFLDGLAAILKDPAASDNDRFVAGALLRNAVIAAEGELPLCQDTGTINVFGRKGHLVLTDGRDEEALALAASGVYRGRNLRYSIMAPRTVLEEVNTGRNLPAQIDLAAAEGDAYKFLFMAKGGGSSNKTLLFQETKALLNEKSLAAFLAEKIAGLGVAACPPYRIAVVVGGLSPEMTVKTVKLATAGYLDGLPKRGSTRGGAFRDRAWEERMMEAARATGLGAQFGGRHLALEVRFIRLPRHAGSCPVGIGVGCNADRNLKAKITAKAFSSKSSSGARPGSRRRELRNGPAVAWISTGRWTGSWRSQGLASAHWSSFWTARRRPRLAHARLAKMLRETGELRTTSAPPRLLRRPPRPEGMASGSLARPTPSAMDGYLAEF